jgi:D-alanyl-D-alanine carboxypeptidase
VLPSFFEVSDIQYEDSFRIENERSEINHFSSPLSMHLKQVNIYSNNFYADRIFDQLGGQNSFHKYLYEKFNINSRDTRFDTGSGLGENRTTCSTTLKVLESLKNFTLNSGLNLKDIISVAGSDSGTLKDRFKDSMSHRVLAKTGTLRHTSTLAGFLGKDQTHIFAVFNHTYKTGKARKMQNKFIKFYSETNATTKFSYRPINYLSVLNTIIK